MLQSVALCLYSHSLLANIMKKYFLLLVLAVTAFSMMQAQPYSDLYDNAKVHELRLTIGERNWMDRLDSMRIYGEGMLVGGASIDGTGLTEVGIGYRGSSSYQTGAKRNPFQVKLNYKKAAQNYQGYVALKLSPALRDPSMVREVLGYEIANRYMIAPRASYVQLYINNENYGLYVMVESIDEAFLKLRFGTADNPFFKCTPDTRATAKDGCKSKEFGAMDYEPNLECYKANYDMMSARGWEDLQNMTRILNQNPTDVAKVLDIDKVLWMLAYNNVLVNLSSYSGQYSHNFYLYQDHEGQFVPMIWDLNLNFGSFKNIGNGSDLDLAQLQTLDPLLHADNAAKPLISKLLAQPDYKRIYLSHMRTIVYDVFESGWYKDRATELQALVGPAFASDPFKYYTVNDLNASMTTTVGEKSKIPGIVELMGKRAKFLKKHPELTPFPPLIADVQVANRSKFSNKEVTEFRFTVKVDKFPKRVKLFYRADGEISFQEVYMQDDGKSNDGVAGDKVFGVAIKTMGYDTIEYYIMAEGAAMVSYEPTNYMQALREVSLKELNK